MNTVVQPPIAGLLSQPLSQRAAKGVAIVTLLVTALLLVWLNRPENIPGTNVVEHFPMDLNGRWLGTNLVVTQRERDILQATGIVMRSYASIGQVPAAQAVNRTNRPNQVAEPVLLYIAFYHSQRTGATYHSPQNCMPGAGWQMTDVRAVGLPEELDVNAKVNEVILQKGLEKQLVMYWYQDRGRIIADEYWAKAYMIWDATTSNRSDGSLVRISTTVTDGEDAARAQLRRFVQDLWPTLTATLPGMHTAHVEPITAL